MIKGMIEGIIKGIVKGIIRNNELTAVIILNYSS